MFIAEFNISIDVRFLQPEKAYCPMLVTEFGIVTDDIPVQSQYLQLVVCQSILSKTVEK